MSSAPDEIRIRDLAEPILTDLQRSLREAAEKIPVDLSVEGVLRAAREQTGLGDFGPDDFRERLSVWVQAIDEDQGLAASGRVAAFRDCVRYAGTRLRLEDFVKRHPEALDVAIERPIIVVGLPRSGTTHLLNLIAAEQHLSIEQLQAADRFNAWVRWLIEQAGWKGRREGNVGMHSAQALVLVNHANATGEEVLGFAEQVRHDIDGLHHGPVDRVSHDVAREGAVDLDIVDREFLQVDE